MDQGMTSRAEVRAPHSWDSIPRDSAPTPKRPGESPAALAELADASRQYSEAAGQYMVARESLEAARSRWQHLRDAVAKTTEADGV